MTMQTFTPLEYLKIDIASQYGLDKSSWTDRINWTDKHEQDLEGLQEEAEEPAQYYAAVKAYRTAQAGEPISYGVSLDATASGAQILSILIGCEKSARLCNVVDTGNREDFYTNIYEAWKANSGSSNRIDRKKVKQAVMTSLYGSKAIPVEIFGLGDMLDAFYQTMQEAAPGAWSLNQELLALWDPTASIYEWVMPDNFHVKIKVMDDEMESFTFLGQKHETFFKVNRPVDEGRSLGANTAHSIDGMIVREILRRCSHDRRQVDQTMILCNDRLEGNHLPKKFRDQTRNVQMVKRLAELHEESGFLSARIIDFIDEESIFYAPCEALMELLLSLPQKSFPVLSIHDCFKVHPNYANDLRRQYNQILSEIAGSQMLQSIARQFSGQGEDLKVTKYGDLTEQALLANYALS